MISHVHRFVYLDIVKTGGTSICKLLAEFGGVGKHHSIARELPWLGVNKDLPLFLPEEIITDYFKFTFVRNPFDRVLSLFGYCQVAPLQKRYAQFGWDGLSHAVRRLPRKALDRKTYWPTEFPEFIDWLLRYEDYYSDYYLGKYVPMVDWLSDRNGDIRVDDIGRYETMETDLRRILTRLNLPFRDLERLNVSPSAPRTQGVLVLARERRITEQIINHYYKDFETFDYPKTFRAA